MSHSFSMLSSIINILHTPVINGDFNNILQSSFNETKDIEKPTSNNFIKSLKEHTFTEDDENISCGICLETFKKGETAIILPCKQTPHYFHKGDNSEDCGGILPWLNNNNTCPICRDEFPIEEKKKEVDEEVAEEVDEEVAEEMDEEVDEVDEGNADENNEISRFLDEMNEYNEDEEEDENVDQNIENMLNELNTEELSNLLANSIILSNLLRPPVSMPTRRIRRHHRNIILNQRSIEELEEIQLNEALERSMTEI